MNERIKRDEINRLMDEFKSRGGQTKVLEITEQARTQGWTPWQFKNRKQRSNQDEDRNISTPLKGHAP